MNRFLSVRSLVFAVRNGDDADGRRGRVVDGDGVLVLTAPGAVVMMVVVVGVVVVVGLSMVVLGRYLMMPIIMPMRRNVRTVIPSAASNTVQLFRRRSALLNPLFDR